jgi:hypothetical protein
VPVFTQPAAAQPATVPAAPAVVTDAEPVPVPAEAPGGSSTPMRVSTGVAVGIVVLGVGLIIACGIACAN